VSWKKETSSGLRFKVQGMRREDRRRRGRGGEDGKVGKDGEFKW
jgi:hypothetical protein